MTEDEWATAEETDLRMFLLRMEARRQRLLAVAAVRALGRWADQPVLLTALEAAERFADTGKSKAALKRAKDALADARAALGVLPADPADRREWLGRCGALFAATRACAETGADPSTIREVIRAWESEGLTREAGRRRLYPVYRDVAGPDPVPAFDPAWRTTTAVRLARQMYDGRDFTAMPILADALQDAGCEDAELLGHCRDAGLTHARGCWVVDLVLGKT